MFNAVDAPNLPLTLFLTLLSLDLDGARVGITPRGVPYTRLRGFRVF